MPETAHPYIVTDEMVDDILVAAFEGGSTYWCREVEVPEWPEGAEFASDACGRYGVTLTLVFDDPEEEEGSGALARKPLTREDMRRGIRKAAEHFGRTVVNFYEHHDAGDADVALQLALFGEVIYA